MNHHYAPEFCIIDDAPHETCVGPEGNPFGVSVTVELRGVEAVSTHTGVLRRQRVFAQPTGHEEE